MAELHGELLRTATAQRRADTASLPHRRLAQGPRRTCRHPLLGQQASTRCSASAHQAGPAPLCDGASQRVLCSPMGEPPAHTAAHFGAVVGAGPHRLWGSSGRNMGGAGHAAPTRPASVTELPFLGIQHLVKEKQKHHAENAFLVTSH